MLNIFYGRESLDKEKFIFDNIGDRALLIVPDQFTLEAERELFRSLKTESLIDVEVISMSRLGYRLLQELGGAKRSFIDKYGRHMILTGVVEKEKDKLQVFKGLHSKDSFIEMVNNFISELKQFNLGVDELRDIIDRLEPADENICLRMKLEDLLLIYECYEKKIEGKHTDSEDYIDLFLGKINDSKLIRGNHIWIYGFDSFAPKAMAIIGELMETAADVNVVITASGNTSDRDSDIFFLEETVMENLERNAESRGVGHSRRPVPATCLIENKAPAIAHIEKEIYAVPGEKLYDLDAGIHLVEAANIYSEAESAASFVLSLVRDKGYRYNEIKVILNDTDTRGPVLERVFREYGIPLFSDNSRDILKNPIILYVLSLLEIASSRYAGQAVPKLLKSGFTELTDSEAFDLENYAIKYRIRGTMWKKPFRKGRAEFDSRRKDGEAELARLEALRKKAIEPVLGFEELFDAETNEEFIGALYRYLYEEVKLPEKITDLMERQSDAGREDLAEETSQVWGSLIGILDQMTAIIGNEKFKPGEFTAMLENGLSQVKIGVLPPTEDGLVSGTCQRTRTGKVRALVVVGMNEGVFPMGRPSDGILGSDEKEFLTEKGLSVCKADSVMLMEEKLSIYRNLSRPSEELFVSCSLTDIDGGSLRPSAIFIKLKELFPDVEVKRDIVTEGRPENLINGSLSGLRHMTEALQKVADGEEIEDEWKEALAWYKENRHSEIYSIRSGLAFTNEEKPLGKDLADELYSGSGTDALSLSPSRVEKYSRCPFSHFMNYGLKPEERRIYEVAAREIGDVYHECLKVLAEKLSSYEGHVTDPESPWMKITPSEIRELVEHVVDEQAIVYKEGLMTDGPEAVYRLERIKDIAETVCTVMVEQVRAGRIEACAFEEPFKRGQRIKPIELKAGDKTVLIEGKIDRVDYLRDDRVKIIDYKTGDESFSREEAEQGYRLQLMLYLEAVLREGKKPAGVFYFHVAEPKIDMNGRLLNEEEISAEIRKAFKLNGLMLEDESVIQSMVGELQGYSDIIPVSRNKDGALRGSIISEEDFDEFRENFIKKVTEICTGLTGGNIDIHPMKTGSRSACTYCDYRSVCCFDTVFEANKYNIIR